MTTAALAEITIEIPNEWWMTSNHRLHWRKKAVRTKWLRHLAAVQARQAGLPRDLPTPVEVKAYISYPGPCSPDPNNAEPTTKALVDGLTDYGCWPDDDRKHVIGPDHRFGGVTRGKRTVRLVITPEDRPSDKGGNDA